MQSGSAQSMRAVGVVVEAVVADLDARLGAGAIAEAARVEAIRRVVAVVVLAVVADLDAWPGRCGGMSDRRRRCPPPPPPPSLCGRRRRPPRPARREADPTARSPRRDDPSAARCPANRQHEPPAVMFSQCTTGACAGPSQKSPGGRGSGRRAATAARDSCDRWRAGNRSRAAAPRARRPGKPTGARAQPSSRPNSCKTGGMPPAPRPPHPEPGAPARRIAEVAAGERRRRGRGAGAGARGSAGLGRAAVRRAGARAAPPRPRACCDDVGSDRHPGRRERQAALRGGGDRALLHLRAHALLHRARRAARAARRRSPPARLRQQARARRLPPARRGRRDRSLELAAAQQLRRLRRAAGVRQRGRPQAVGVDAADVAAGAGALARAGAARGRVPGRHRARATSGAALCREGRHDLLHRQPEGGAADRARRRRAADPGRARAGRQVADDRAGRRRPAARRARRRLERLRAQRAGLHAHRTGAGRGAGRRRASSSCAPPRSRACARDRRRRRTAIAATSTSTSAPSPSRRRSTTRARRSPTPSPRGRASSTGGARARRSGRGAVLRADADRRRHARDGGDARGDLRAGAADHARPRRRDGAAHRQRLAARPVGQRLVGRRGAGARAGAAPGGGQRLRQRRAGELLLRRGARSAASRRAASGVRHGPEGLRQFCRLETVVEDHPLLGLLSPFVDRQLTFPYRSRTLRRCAG